MSTNLQEKFHISRPKKEAEKHPTILDTLAQLRKAPSDVHYRRAKSKFLTTKFILSLVDLDSPLKNSYWRTFYCSNSLLFNHEKQKLTGRYCNARWCLVCNRIRSAKLINQYIGEISKMNDLYFVTLTFPNVGGLVLRKSIKQMQSDFRRILDKHRKRGNPITGVRKLECTYNQHLDNFNPHYHVLVDGMDQAYNLLNDWLSRYPDANIKAQDIRKANEGAVMELFKYFTKVVTRKRGGNKNHYEIHLQALDKINQAFYRMRVFQGFGGIKANISEEIEDIQAEELETMFDGCVFEWVQDISDWVSEYGEQLTNNDHYKKIKLNTI